jgi:3-oxoacyl-[acyl-carrier-protein] synthase-3
VRERRWADPDAAASDLAVEAIRKLGLRDFRGSLFLSTISQDYLTPSTAALVKKELGLSGRCPAVDINAACAGQLFALDLAVNRLAAGAEDEALVVATEVRSRFLNPRDRRTVFLFGDGACAFHLQRADDAPGCVEWVHSSTVPSDSIEILVPAGGSRRPLSAEVLAEAAQFISLRDGPKIVESTTRLLVEEIGAVLSGRGQRLDDFDRVLFHQGNAAISRAMCESLGIAPERTWSNFERYGNTSSASLGIAFAEMVAQGRVERGARILLVAMGAGYHLGMASVVWGR